MHHVFKIQSAGFIASICITTIHFAPLALRHTLFPIAELQYPTSFLIEMNFRSIVIFNSL